MRPFFLSGAIGDPALPKLRQMFGRGEPTLRYCAAVALKEMNKTSELLPAIDEELAGHHNGE